MCQEAPFAPGINSHPAIFFFELIGRYEVVGYLYIYIHIYIYIFVEGRVSLSGSKKGPAHDSRTIHKPLHRESSCVTVTKKAQDPNSKL